MKKTLLFILFPCLIYGQTQIGQDIDGEMPEDQSGSSVSISSNGDVVAIGAPFNDGNGDRSGHVRVYGNQAGTWIQIGQDIDGEAIDDFSGRATSLSSDGSIIAIGGDENDGNGFNSGHVRVYENQGGNWIQIGQDIDGEASGDTFGNSVSLSSDGTVIAIGGVFNNDISGHVRIYENQGGAWIQIGQDIDGEASQDFSGIDVSISSNGTIVAIGANRNDENGSNSGHVRIYENQSGTWVQISQDIDGETSLDFSGNSVSLSSNGAIVAIGGPGNDGNGDRSGHVRVYENQGGNWTQIGQDIDGEASGDVSGASVSLSPDGNVLAIGGNENDDNGDRSGHTRIYENQGGTWIQIGDDIDGEATDDFSGINVSLSSNGIVAIGAFRNDGNGNSSGHVRVYDLSDLLSIEESILSDFKLFPNPTSGQVYIELLQGVLLEKVNVYNSLGQLLHSTKETMIQTSDLTKGIYFVEIVTDQGKITKRLIKE